MSERLSVYAIVEPGPASGIEGYKTLTLMKLPIEEANKKANLVMRIQEELENLNRELPQPTDQSLDVEWEKDYHSVSEQRVSPLHLQNNSIRGPLKAYVVRTGQYRLGQVLDEVPTDAVPVDKFFKQK